MRKIIHIIKNSNDPHALDVIDEQRKNDQVYLVLAQGAVSMMPPLPKEAVFVLKEDAAERQFTPAFPTIDYAELLKLILDADAVVTW